VTWEGSDRQTNLGNTLLEGMPGEWSRSVDRASVIIRTPRRTVDVDVLRSETERLGFHRVRDVAVQHSHSCTNTPCSHHFYLHCDTFSNNSNNLAWLIVNNFWSKESPYALNSTCYFAYTESGSLELFGNALGVQFLLTCYTSGAICCLQVLTFRDIYEQILCLHVRTYVRSCNICDH